MSTPAPQKPTPVPASKPPQPAVPAPPAPAEEPPCSDKCLKKRIGIIVAAVTVAAAISIPILCAILNKEEEEEEEKEKEKEVKLTGNAVLEKLVTWVKEIKGANSSAEQEDTDYEEIATVADFSMTQSL